MGFSEILGFVGSAATGGITGLIGMLASGVLGYFKEKDERAHQLALKDKDLQLMRLEADNAVKISEAARLTMQAQQDGEAFTASQQLGNQSILQAGVYEKASRWAINGAILVEAFMRTVRPALTAMALAALTWVAVKSYEKLAGAAITADQAQVTWMECVQAVIYIATTSYIWWFGSRDQRKGAKVR